jgi:hypothetical protein
VRTLDARAIRYRVAGAILSGMLQVTTLLHCACCAAATAEFERGWRAYVGEERSIEVVCPACAERVRGEDETA